MTNEPVSRFVTTFVVAVPLTFVVCERSHAAFPTAVNSQITDSVTQANVKVLGESPAIALGNLYQATAQALANAAHNATTAQQHMMVTAQAATTMGVATLYSIDTASTGIATKAILSGGAAAGTAAGTVPPEGTFAGVSLLMFDNDGVAEDVADYFVLTDEGYDFFTDSDGNLILRANRVRTLGEALSPATEVGYLLPPHAVEQYFPNLYQEATGDELPSGVAAGVAPELPFDVYIGTRYADGQTFYYQGYLAALPAVPEPGSLALLAIGSLPGVGRRRRFD